MFKIGDLVEWDNKQGVIVEIDQDGWLGVDFGRGHDGHNLNGKLSRNTGWYIAPEWAIRHVVIDLENK